MLFTLAWGALLGKWTYLLMLYLGGLGQRLDANLWSLEFGCRSCSWGVFFRLWVLVGAGQSNCMVAPCSGGIRTRFRIFREARFCGECSRESAGQLNSEMRREKSEEFRPEVDPLSRGGVHGGIWSRKALDPGQRNLSNVARNCVSSTCVFLIRAASPFSFLPQSRSLPSNR